MHNPNLARMVSFPGFGTRRAPCSSDAPAAPSPDPAGAPPAPAGDDAAAGVTRMTYARQGGLAFAHAIRTGRRCWREAKDREGSRVSQAITATWSIRHTLDYAGSRAWVLRGHAGGIAEHSGVAYFAVIGKPWAFYAGWLHWVHDRPLRWAAWAAVRFGLAMAILTMLGHGRLAAQIAGGVLAALVITGVVLSPRTSPVRRCDEPGCTITESHIHEDDLGAEDDTIYGSEAVA